MKKAMIGLVVAVSLSFVSDCFAEGLVVVIGGGDTIWTRTCQTCAWTQVPGNLKTAAVVWDAGMERYVLYGTNARGEIYTCTFDRGGNFQNDWDLVEGYAQWTTGASAQAMNPQQVALLRWYGANQTGNQFTVGSVPTGIAFDGASIWVANEGSANVTKLRASDGANLGTFAVGLAPNGIAFDGANIWVVNFSSNNVTKLRASDGANLGTFAVGSYPRGIAFDGANIWVANLGSANVTKLRTSDGASLGTFAVGTGPFGIAFDGANIWVTNYGSSSVSKL
jgi:hypothetical protein